MTPAQQVKVISWCISAKPGIYPVKDKSSIEAFEKYEMMRQMLCGCHYPEITISKDGSEVKVHEVR